MTHEKPPPIVKEKLITIFIIAHAFPGVWIWERHIWACWSCLQSLVFNSQWVWLILLSVSNACALSFSMFGSFGWYFDPQTSYLSLIDYYTSSRWSSEAFHRRGVHAVGLARIYHRANMLCISSLGNVSDGYIQAGKNISFRNFSVCSPPYYFLWDSYVSVQEVTHDQVRMKLPEMDAFLYLQGITSN
jgi:hypothetical protein